MSMWFHWMAYTRLLKCRARTVLRMTCISFLTAIIAASGFCLGMAAWLDVERMSRDVVMDVFVQPEAADSTVASYVTTIYSLPGVAHAEFDASDRVWEKFSERLDIGDSDLGAVVHLPHRIRLVMTSLGTTASRMTETEHLASMIVGDDLVHVAWSPSQVSILAHRREELRIGMIVGGVLFMLLVMVSVVYSFRAEVHDAGNDLAVGAVLGAAPSTSAFPHFLVCATASIAGGGLACLLLAFARPHLLQSVPWIGSVPYLHAVYVVLVVTAALIVEGWLLTFAAARKSARHGKADRAT